MAANKFAATVHRRSNKTTLVLVYAALEWSLIILLLLNSLFSFLILRFADFFGLPRPCPLCSRLDHVFSPRRHTPLRDLLCSRHADELKQAEDCGSDVSDEDRRVDDHEDEEFGEFKAAEPRVVEEPVTGEEDQEVVLTSMEKDVREDYVFEVERDCFSSFDHKIVLLEADGRRKDESLKDSSGCHLEFFIGGNECELIPVEGTGSTAYPRLTPIMKEEPDECGGLEDVIMDFSPTSARELFPGIDKNATFGSKIAFLEQCGTTECVPDESFAEEVSAVDSCIEENKSLDNKFEDLSIIEMTEVLENASEEIWGSLVEGGYGQEPGADNKKNSSSGSKYEEFEFDTLQITRILENASEEEQVSSNEEGNAQIAGCPDDNCDEKEETLLPEGGRGGGYADDCRAAEEECTLQNDDIELAVSRRTEIPDQEHGDCFPVNAASEEKCISQNDDIEPEVSIGPEIPDQEPIDVNETYDEDTLSWDPCREVDTIPSTSREFLHMEYLNGHDANNATSEMEALEFRPISVEPSSEASNHQLEPELSNENEDERIPDTPNSMDSLHQLHRSLLLLEKLDTGSTEESLDGSLIGEIEGDDGMLTVEKLKSALKAERKALHALYTELDEERNASAVAASHTMAMINRLQEEKAAMQMEALQYQRMMEEQVEYDQEALHLLNDLMVKREKEKQELEVELEVYRKKVEEYEVKEKKRAMMVVPRDIKDGSDSCSHEEESDGLSVDLNVDAKGGEDSINGYGSTPREVVWYLEESLTNFEKERALILKQLKTLEEKTLNVNSEEEQEGWHCRENGNDHVENGSENGHCKMNGNGYYHRHSRLAGPKAKNLLPLFDSIGEETRHEWSHRTPSDHFEEVIADEVDHIYERLQAFEADRELLKHCIGTSRKGDKGLELLGEILQHLRYLRCTELHGQNLINGNGV